MSKLKERKKQINDYSAPEAQRELDDLRKKLLQLRLQKQRHEVKNNRQFAQVRTDIARLLHRLGELNREAESAEEK